MFNTGLPKKDETVKTTGNSYNVAIPRLNYVFCLRYNYIMTCLMIWQRKKQVYSCRES